MSLHIVHQPRPVSEFLSDALSLSDQPQTWNFLYCLVISLSLSDHTSSLRMTIMQQIKNTSFLATLDLVDMYMYMHDRIMSVTGIVDQHLQACELNKISV